MIKTLCIAFFTLLSFLLLIKIPAHAADVCLTGEGMRPVYNTLLVCVAVVQVFLLLVLNALVQAGWGKSYKQSMVALLIDHYFDTPKGGMGRVWTFLCVAAIFVGSLTVYQYYCWQRGVSNKPSWSIEQTVEGYEAAGLRKLN